MGSNPSKFQEGWSAGLRPVETVSFSDVEAFLDKLNEGDREFMGFEGTWRLPSEIEWEYAAKQEHRPGGHLVTKMRNLMHMDGTQATVELQQGK